MRTRPHAWSGFFCLFCAVTAFIAVSPSLASGAVAGQQRTPVNNRVDRESGVSPSVRAAAKLKEACQYLIRSTGKSSSNESRVARQNGVSERFPRPQVAFNARPLRRLFQDDEVAKQQEMQERREELRENLQEELKQPVHFEPMPSRWYRDPWSLLPGPPYVINEPGDNLLDPYRQNVLKGDFPIMGEDLFLRLTLTERAIVEGRSIPLQAPLSSPSPGGFGFFGKSDQFFFTSKTALTVDLFKGQEAFKPVDWRVRVTGVVDYTLLAISEYGGVNINIGDPRTRETGDLSLQEALVEIHLFDLNDRFDFISSEVGIFPFRSDFRGFIFDDVNLGVRLFGNADDNKWQYNAVFFHMLENDTNSDLLTFDERDQQVLILNVYRQDFLWLGYTLNLSFHYNHDEPSTHFNVNDFLVRPQPVGLAKEKEIHAYYFGFAGDGKFGRVNITHAFYQVYGSETNNAFAARDTNIDAQFAAIELSYDLDWWRIRVYGMYASGDKDPFDKEAEGFDAIRDLANFAGGEVSYFNRQQIQLIGVGLTTRFSFLPDLTTSRLEGQSNFVNPGLWLFGAAINADITPTLRGQIGFNHLRFDESAVLEVYLEVEDISNEIGNELYFSAQWRPLLTNNIIANFGASVFFPGDGFEKIYQTDETQYSVFFDLIVTY